MGVVEEPVDGRGGEGLGSWRETESAIPRAHPANASVLVGVRSVRSSRWTRRSPHRRSLPRCGRRWWPPGLLAEGVPLPSCDGPGLRHSLTSRVSGSRTAFHSLVLQPATEPQLPAFEAGLPTPSARFQETWLRATSMPEHGADDWFQTYTPTLENGRCAP